VAARVEQHDSNALGERSGLWPKVARAPAESVLKHERRTAAVTLDVKWDLVHGVGKV